MSGNGDEERERMRGGKERGRGGGGKEKGGKECI